MARAKNTMDALEKAKGSRRVATTPPLVPFKEEQEAAPAVKSTTATHYRVHNKDGRRISWGGHVTHLQEGQILAVSAYTLSGIKKLQAQGIDLRPVG